MENKSVSVRTITIKRDLKFNQETVLTYKIQYPELNSALFKNCLPEVNRYYRNKALEYERYIENELYAMAVDQYKDSIENGYPVRIFGAGQEFTVTYLNGCIFSLYLDRYEYTGGAHGLTARQSQTWQLQKCEILKIEKVVRCYPDPKSYLLPLIEAQIRKEPDLYFENYSQLIDETFNPESFYLAPKALVIYYQQYDIAPYASGIREFSIPYSGCVKSPQRLCL